MIKRKISLGNVADKCCKNGIAIERERILSTFAEYLRFDKRYSPKNIENIAGKARRLLYAFDLSLPPTVEDARRIETAMSGTVKASTIKHYLLTIKLLGAHMGSPLDIKLPKVCKAETDYLTLPEARAMLESCQNLRDLTMLTVLLTTGVRNSECIRLRVADVDLRNKVLHVRDRGEGMKNYREKKCFLTDRAVDVLRQWIDYRDTLSIESDYLFITVDGEPFSGRERLNRIVKSIAREAGINRPVRCHMMRHSAAMLMLRSGIPLTSVARALGHTSVSTTTEYYLHGSQDDELRADIKKLVI